MIALLCNLVTPNIVVILADDFGVGDVQAHYPKNKIPTPHLDQVEFLGELVDRRGCRESAFLSSVVQE